MCRFPSRLFLYSYKASLFTITITITIIPADLTPTSLLPGTSMARLWEKFDCARKGKPILVAGETGCLAGKGGGWA